MPIQPHHRRYVLGDATPGVCRFCREAIRHPRTNAILTRQTWHHGCVQKYKEIAWPNVLRKAILRRDNGVCAKCGKVDPGWQADHIIPLKLGGSFEHHNIQTLCVACHKVKSTADRKAIREAGKAEVSPSSNQTDK